MRAHEPPEATHLRRVEDAWIEHSRLWAHELIAVPPVGMTETFTTGHSAAEDRIYSFSDRAGRSLSLVPDSLTAIMAHLARGGATQRRVCFSCPVFRYRHSRRRYFHQLGAMTLSTGGATLNPYAEMRHVEELLTMALKFITPFFQVRVTLSDIGLWRSALLATVAQERLPWVLHSLAALPPQQRAAWLADIIRSPSAARLAEIIAEESAFLPSSRAADRVLASLTVDARTRAGRLLAMGTRVHAAGTAIVSIDLGELHASEHHDGFAFQILAVSDERRISDGGAYSEFASQMFARTVSLYSVAFGLEEIASRVVQKPQALADISFQVSATSEAIAFAAQLSGDLRDRGIRVLDGDVGRALGKELARVRGAGIPFSVVIGDREVETRRLRIHTSDGVRVHDVDAAVLGDWLGQLVARDPRGLGH